MKDLHESKFCLHIIVHSTRVKVINYVWLQSWYICLFCTRLSAVYKVWLSFVFRMYMFMVYSIPAEKKNLIKIHHWICNKLIFSFCDWCWIPSDSKADAIDISKAPWLREYFRMYLCIYTYIARRRKGKGKGKGTHRGDRGYKSKLLSQSSSHFWVSLRTLSTCMNAPRQREFVLVRASDELASLRHAEMPCVGVWFRLTPKAGYNQPSRSTSTTPGTRDADMVESQSNVVEIDASNAWIQSGSQVGSRRVLV